MKRVVGSSPLNEEQQDFYLKRDGVRYHAIAENPLRPSRAMRRANRFRGKRHARGLQPSDAELNRLQHRAAQQLSEMLARPVL